MIYLPFKRQALFRVRGVMNLPYQLVVPKGAANALVVSSPHSGRHYSAAFLQTTKLNDLDVRRSEDAYVDELVRGAPKAGATLICATFPRAFVDANRDARELDPTMFDAPLPEHVVMASQRVAAGLGVIPNIVSDSLPLYKTKLPLQEAVSRVRDYYLPFHEVLASSMRRAHQRHGYGVLLDMHSMPSKAWTYKAMPDVVLGDRFGAACTQDLSCYVQELLQGLGLRVVRNKPYAGGYITQRYGQPQNQMHALQIEINRGLYMNEEIIAKHEGFGSLQQALDEVFFAISKQLEDLCAPNDAQQRHLDQPPKAAE